MGIKVAKFGGTSLADAKQIRKVQAIIKQDPQRRFVVPSAPGKRTADDRKITDLLYLCHADAKQRLPFDEAFNLIAQRYQGIVSELGLGLDLKPVLDDIRKNIALLATDGADYAASRGEYLSGLILSALLGYEFIDAAEVIFFTARGVLDQDKTQQALADRLLKAGRAVVPGFYGSMPDGKIKTFSRGGSDVSGALVARGVGAEVYENWTDVNGLLMADPRIVTNARKMDVITYRELRELSYMGATVLHDEAVFPVRKAGIPVNIRNTNEPSQSGTTILPDDAPVTNPGSISGIAGKKNFTVIHVEKALMNSEIGFGRRLLTVLETNDISYEHTPTGIDTMSVIVASAQLESKAERVIEQIRLECAPDHIEIEPDLALIATVGRGMAQTLGISAQLFTALAQANVNVRMIDQGSSEINIIVGVSTIDFEKAMIAIYNAFVPG